MKGAKLIRPIVVREVGGWRRSMILFLMTVGACTLLIRAFQLQVLQRDFLAHEGQKRSTRTIAVRADRGVIRDRNGEPLALSAPVESLWAIPSELLAAPEYLPALSKMLEMKPRELEHLLRERAGKQFVYLRRQVAPDDANRVLALKAPGVFAQREFRRYYPAGEVAGHVVGFTGSEGRGQEGMEAAQESRLAGKDGERRVIRDRAGHVIEESEDFIAAKPGQDVRLTLDLRLQYLAYRELKNAVAKNKAKGGLMVVADAQTGDILAMATQPGFNPNRPEARNGASLRNRAVTDIFEPGSTIKPLLVARALEVGAFRATDHIETAPGTFKVGRLLVRDTHPHGLMDLAELLSVSSNVGAAKIGLRLGPQAIHAGYQAFGLGEPVRSGFPGESSGYLMPAAKWGEIATATASYGYGMSVNALTMVRAYCALANDGLMPQLSIIKRDSLPEPRRAVPAKVAREVRRMMEGVVSVEGTAQKAGVAGYRVSGKTGTIRKNEGHGYFANRHQSVFMGMLPAEHTRLVGLVMIDEPAAGIYYGGLIAAPVFATVMQNAARMLQLPPDEPLPVLPPVIKPGAPVRSGKPVTQTAGVPGLEPRT
jgi:cell division protein FtsI (penicillin-binding protein 3)